MSKKRVDDKYLTVNEYNKAKNRVFLSMFEAMRLLQCSRRTLYRYIEFYNIKTYLYKTKKMKGSGKMFLDSEELLNKIVEFPGKNHMKFPIIPKKTEGGNEKAHQELQV